MGLWDNPKRMTPEEDAALTAMLKDNLPSPEEVARRWAEHLKTHCEHGHLRTDHCPWCYVQTPEYKSPIE